MRRILFTTLAALTVAAVSASADMTRETTTSSTTYSGTVSSLSPTSKTIILKSESAPEPSQYVLSEKTTFVDPAGNIVSREAVQNQPVTIYTEKQGDQMVVTKVVTQKTVSAPKVEKKTTTTTTESESVE
jgi:hypothetical protein